MCCKSQSAGPGNQLGSRSQYQAITTSQGTSTMTVLGVGSPQPLSTDLQRVPVLMHNLKPKPELSP